MKVPGEWYHIILAAASAGLVAMATVLQQAIPAQFPDAVWTGLAVTALGTIISLAKAWGEKDALPATRSTFPEEKRSFWGRFWLG